MPIIRATSRIGTQPSRCNLNTSRTSRIFGLLVGMRSSRLKSSRKDRPTIRLLKPQRVAGN
jgi:hypothetical protein